VSATQDHGASDGVAIQEINRETKAAEGSSPGVWPEWLFDSRSFGPTRNSLISFEFRGTGNKGPNLRDCHVEPQVGIGHDLARLVLQSNGQLDQPQTVEPELTQSLVVLHRDRPRSARHSLRDRIIRGQHTRHLHTLQLLRHRKQVSPDLERRSTREIRLVPPRSTREALMLCQATITPGDERTEIAGASAGG